jgi:hypothetical protein
MFERNDSLGSGIISNDGTTFLGDAKGITRGNHFLNEIKKKVRLGAFSSFRVLL